MSGQADLTHNDVVRLLEIIDKSEDIEIRVEYDGLTLHVVKGGAAKQHLGNKAPEPVSSKQPTETRAVAGPASAERTPASRSPEAASSPHSGIDTGAIPPGARTICAPLVGRFYRSSSPTEPPFVELGGTVAAEDTVGVIEVMKLFNEIKSGVNGTILEIRAANEEMVQEGQVLFVVRAD